MKAIFVVALFATIGSILADSVGTAILLQDAANQYDARCLDGTPGLYYLRPGFDEGSNNWYIFHMGG